MSQQDSRGRAAGQPGGRPAGQAIGASSLQPGGRAAEQRGNKAQGAPLRPLACWCLSGPALRRAPRRGHCPTSRPGRGARRPHEDFVSCAGIRADKSAIRGLHAPHLKPYSRRAPLLVPPTHAPMGIQERTHAHPLILVPTLIRSSWYIGVLYTLYTIYHAAGTVPGRPAYSVIWLGLRREETA